VNPRLPRYGCVPWLCLLLPAFWLTPQRVAAAEIKRQEVAASASETTHSLDELLSVQKQVQAVLDRSLRATVGIRVGSAQGSGVIVSPEGHVLTAAHVISKPGQDATVLLSDGRQVRGKTLGVYTTLDAGLMKITDDGQWPMAEQGVSAGVGLGAWCVAIGHPLGYQDGRPPVVRVGRVLRTGDDQIQTDCPLVAGDSGGPLFDLRGRVIGINSRIGGSTDMNYHVPVDVFRNIWDRLAGGDSWEDDLPRRESRGVTAALGQLIHEAAQCVVRVECGGHDVALGTIVAPAGWIVTKASELKGTPVCHLPDSRNFQAHVVNINEPFDLAILKIDADRLPQLPWSTSAAPEVGQWVAAPGPVEGSPLGLGVISVPRRPIPAARGVLGVALARAKEGARVAKVLPDTPAEKSGLMENDVITHFDGQTIHHQDDVLEALRSHGPGDLIRLTIRRGSDDLEILATLGTLDSATARKRDLQNRSDVGISRRHDDFPVVIQHDMVLKPTECGGPLVDLTGNVIGINVARGGRTETYSVPADALLPILDALTADQSVSLAPSKVTGGDSVPGEPAAAIRSDGAVAAD